MDISETATAYLEALFEKEYEKALSFLHSDFSFQSPTDCISGATKFMDMIKSHGNMKVEIAIKKVFSENDEACVIYDWTTSATGTIPFVEWMKTDGRKIVSSLCYHDTAPFSQFSRT